VTPEGNKIEAMNLGPNDLRTPEYFATYGGALSRLNQCSEALQVARTILERVPSDETAVENANAIITRCQQNLDSTPEPIQTPLEPASPTEALPTPTEIPTPTS
jgi:hypothetical protein